MRDKDPWEELWKSTKETSENNEVSKSEVWNQLKIEIERKNKRKQRIRIATYAAAACVALWVSIVWLGNTSQISTKENAIHIAKQDTLNLNLKDGTLVKLFPNSSIEIDEGFAKKNRKITLKGDAFFDVTKQEKINFEVQANGFSVEVLGTNFIILSNSKHPSVELIEGKLKVNHGNQTAMLTPKQIWKREENGSSLVYFRKDKEGTFVFNNEPYGKAIGKISERYHIEIDYPKALERESVSGEFSGNLTEVLEIISFPFDLKVNKNENKIILEK